MANFNSSLSLYDNVVSTCTFLGANYVEKSLSRQKSVEICVHGKTPTPPHFSELYKKKQYISKYVRIAVFGDLVKGSQKRSPNHFFKAGGSDRRFLSPGAAFSQV